MDERAKVPEHHSARELMSNIHGSRILVVDIRSLRFGYAAFEGPDRLLGFGASEFDSPENARARVAAHLKTFRPSVLVLRRVRPRSTRKRPVWNAVVRAARAEAKRFSVSVAHVTEPALKKFFQGCGCQNKYEVAELLAKQFPEIAWKLPPKRKLYDPEPWTVTYFDAISLGVAYFGRDDESRKNSGD